MFWFGSVAFLQHSLVAFFQTFPNIKAYPQGLSHHPNFKLMGAFWSYFYFARPIFWTYITYRMTRLLITMIDRHFKGKDDIHYFWYYDTLYPDMLHDEEDMRYINFRYTDNKVVPDPLIGYYPYDNLKYGSFLNKKEDQMSIPKTPRERF
jgi:hypothetical protein